VSRIVHYIVPLCTVSILAWLCVSSVFLGVTVVSAQPVINGLGLSPLRSELNIAPGTSLDSKLTVTDATTTPMTVNFNAEEFSVINQQYDYAFTQESQVAKWVTFTPNTVMLAVGEAKTVSFRVSAPLSAEPGGRYISLFASTDTGTQDGGVSSRQRIASLLYITVIGDVTRAGHLVSLSSPRAINGDSKWSMALQNTGTTHFRSRYTVNIHNVLGHDVGTSTSGDALILPGTVRSIADTLPLPPLPGLYRYIYTIGLGDTPAVIETRLVLYVPPVFVIVGSIAIIVLALLFVRMRARQH
jgi:hypothetical protein